MIKASCISGSGSDRGVARHRRHPAGSCARGAPDHAEALTPISRAVADKDQLRNSAMAMSRLEMNVEQMKSEGHQPVAEIGRKSDAIGRLKFELAEKTAGTARSQGRTAHRCPHARERAGSNQHITGDRRRAGKHAGRTRAHRRQFQAELHLQIPIPSAPAAVQAQAALLHDRGLRQREQGIARAPEQQDRRGRGGATTAQRGARPAGRAPAPARLVAQTAQAERFWGAASRSSAPSSRNRRNS